VGNVDAALPVVMYENEVQREKYTIFSFNSFMHFMCDRLAKHQVMDQVESEGKPKRHKFEAKACVVASARQLRYVDRSQQPDMFVQEDTALHGGCGRQMNVPKVI
jgi:imidazoleglycerol phosphate dehydratase HisB